VLDAKTGEQVFAANPDMGLAPGSTLKTVTSITAFNVLGKDFQFKLLWVIPAASSANGTLTGDIIIKGGGDPTLGSWRWASTKEGVVLNTMVTALSKKPGIKKINGRIIGDNGIQKPKHPRWLDLAGSGHLLRCGHCRPLLARKPV
jgi:D-alanyl-D-alanine carboxypeptidase/D-alanyl-D-alanine-endopeptidase (penicillin-binding protein 4)